MRLAHNGNPSWTWISLLCINAIFSLSFWPLYSTGHCQHVLLASADSIGSWFFIHSEFFYSSRFISFQNQCVGINLHFYFCISCEAVMMCQRRLDDGCDAMIYKYKKRETHVATSSKRDGKTHTISILFRFGFLFSLCRSLCTIRM